MSHADVCRAGCSANPTREELRRNHGSPAEFAKAVWNALDMITVAEAQAGIERYEREWLEAGSPPSAT
jgi:hypothetical protein